MIRWLTCQRKTYKKKKKKRYIGWHQPKYFDVWLEPPNMSMTSKKSMVISLTHTHTKKKKKTLQEDITYRILAPSLV